MPELPDIEVYLDALSSRVLNERLEVVRVQSPFLLRTVDPPLAAAAGRKVEKLRRIGKRIAFGLEGDLWLVLHLMIAGRLHWKKPGAALNGRQSLAAFDFAGGSLVLTEAGSQRRAGLWTKPNEAITMASFPGGLEVLEASGEEFARVLVSENHTLKRALTDPSLFSGIGNAYSDEILHAARLSPVVLTQRLTPEEVHRLYDATQSTLRSWIKKLLNEANGKFPEKVTAFREDMAVHGRHTLPCPLCHTKVQRIRYASNETNYCPRCQTGGKLLADRSLSRLLRDDWPKRIEDIE